MDAGGPDMARQHAQAARVRYPVLVDTEGLLAKLYGFRSVPNAWVVDGEGVLHFRLLTVCDIRQPQTAVAIERVLEGASPPSSDASVGPSTEGATAFQEGVRLLQDGRKEEALGAWLRAAEADPDNKLIRRQIWYLLYPQRFEPEIDVAWQDAQREREARLGIRAACPIPDDW